MKLREDYLEVIDRHKALYHGKSGALVYIAIHSLKRKKSKVERDLPKEYLESATDRLNHLLAYYEARKSLKDDLLPSVRPRFGQAELSAFVSVEGTENPVVFEGDTSYQMPIVNSIEDVRKLQFEKNIYLEMTLKSLEYYKKVCEDQCFISLRGANMPLDMANTLRGNELFLDMELEEELVQELEEKCLEFSLQFAKEQMKIVPSYEGGYITGFGAYLEGKAFGHIADDAFCIIGKKYFEKFGYEYTKRFCSHFDSIYYHTHVLCEKELPLIAAIKEVKVIELSRDPNLEEPIVLFKRYAEDIKQKVINLEISFQDLKEQIDFLRDKRLILNMDAANLEEAENIVKFVRENFPIR